MKFRLFILVSVLMMLAACLQSGPSSHGVVTPDMTNQENIDVMKPQVMAPKGDAEMILGMKLLAWRIRFVSQDVPQVVSSWPTDGIIDPESPVTIKTESGGFSLPLLVEISRVLDDQDKPVWISHFRGPRVRLIYVPKDGSPSEILFRDETVEGVKEGGWNVLFSNLRFGPGDLHVYYHEQFRLPNDIDEVAHFRNEEARQQFLADPYTHYLGSFQLMAPETLSNTPGRSTP